LELIEGVILEQLEVSVVIAYHNGSRWIERALQSAFTQTHPAAEVLVVDDGSCGEESSFLSALQEKYPFRILTQENGGQSAARNAGIHEAKSPYVCLLDQDDYFLPRHIEQLLEAVDLDDPKFAFSYGDLWRAIESGQIVAHSCVNRESQHPHTDLKALVGTNMFILPSATLIKREVFLNEGGFDSQFRGYEDDDFFLRLFLAGYTNRFIGDAVTVWTINRSSTSFTESMARSRFNYFKKLLAIFPEGSVAGTRIFGDLMFKRFALQFADDVISSAFNGGLGFSERVVRLKEFRGLVKLSQEVSSRRKSRYLFATLPLVYLAPRTLRLLLLFVIRSGLLFFLPRFQGKAEFVTKYLPRKESLVDA
jgi:glycosyltransferase involved in cell wall biosynthesis